MKNKKKKQFRSIYQYVIYNPPSKSFTGKTGATTDIKEAQLFTKIKADKLLKKVNNARSFACKRVVLKVDEAEVRLIMDL